MSLNGIANGTPPSKPWSRLSEALSHWWNWYASPFLAALFCRFNAKEYVGRNSSGVFLTDSDRVLGWSFLGFRDVRLEAPGLHDHKQDFRAFLLFGKDSIASARCALSHNTEGDYVLYAASKDVAEAFAATGEKNFEYGGLLTAFSNRFVDKGNFFRPIHLYLFIVGLWILYSTMGFFYPKDDLLRHAIAYKWGYDYSIPYFEATYRPPFDFYIAFDIVVGFLHKHIGSYAFLVPQLAALSLTFWGLARMLRGIQGNLSVVVLMVMIVVLAGRFLLGRPSAVCSGLLVFLASFGSSLPFFPMFLLACLMGSMYYLFPIYFVPLLFFDRRYAIPFLASLAFWLVYSHWTYFSAIYALLHSFSQQNMGVGENFTVLAYYLGSSLLFIPFFLNFRKDWRSTLTIVFLSLGNQMRYWETILPFGLSFFRYTKIKMPPYVALLFICFLLNHLYMGHSSGIDMALVRQQIPHGSRVLADMPAMYRMLYADSSLKVSPAYSYGWTPADTQDLLKAIYDGHFDCNNTASGRFDFVVENTLKGPAPSCLMFDSSSGDYRIWKVRSLPPAK